MSADSKKTKEEWLILYAPQGNIPSRGIGNFVYSEQFGAVIYHGRSYDLNNPSEEEQFYEDQKAVQRSRAIKQRRLVICSAKRRLSDLNDASSRAEAENKRIDREEVDRQKAAAKRAAAEEAANKTEKSKIISIDEAPSDEGEEVLPYEDWKFPELKAEAKTRGLKVTAKGKSKDPFVTALEADDEGDGES